MGLFDFARGKLTKAKDNFSTSRFNIPAQAKAAIQLAKPQIQKQLYPVKNKVYQGISATLAPAARAQQFIESPRPVQVPRIPVRPNAGIRTKIGLGVTNLGIDLGNTVLGQGVINPALDVGKGIGMAIRGENMQYNQAKSSPVRLGMQLATSRSPQLQRDFGVNTRPQSLLANIAGTVDPIATAFLPKGAKAISNLSKIRTGAKVGSALGGAFGLSSGLQENEQAPNVFRQFLRSTDDIAIGAAAGGLLGSGTAAAGIGFNKVVSAVKSIKPNVTPEEARKIATQYLKDKTTGKFLGSKKVEPAYYSQLDQQTKYPANIEKAVAEAEKRVGLQVRDVNKDKLISAKMGEPLQLNEVPQKFNIGKVNVDEASAKRLDDFQEALGLSTRKVRSFKEMEELAREVGSDPQKLLRDITTNRITDTEVIGLKNLMNQNSQRIVKLQSELATNPAGADDINNQIDILEDQIKQSVGKIIKGGTEGGRTIAAYRLLAKQTMDPAFWLQKAQKELGNNQITPEIQSAIRSLVVNNDVNGLASFVRSLHQSSFGEKAITLWKAGLLTSPTTSAANIGGNTTMAILENVKNPLAVLIDTLISPVTKQRTKFFTPLKSLRVQASGFKQGLGQGKAILKGESPEVNATIGKFDIRPETNFNNVILDTYTKTVFRLLGAQDKPYKQAALKRSLLEQAQGEVHKMGLKGKEAAEALEQILKNPSDEMAKLAINDAEFATFQNENSVAQMLGKGVVTDFIAPFRRTPANVAARTLDYSPAGFIRTMLMATNPKNRSQRLIVDNLARNITGTGVIGVGTYLASQGLMTGDMPAVAAEREKWTLQGKQPHSILIGGKWRRLDRVSPLGNLLTIGASFHDQYSDGKRGIELAAGTAFAGAKALTEQSFLQGVSRNLGALTDPERYGGNVINATVGSFVPNIVRRTARAIDPTMRKVDNPVDALVAGIPFASKTLLPQRDVLGREKRYGGGRVGQLIDPFGSSRNQTSLVPTELGKLDYRFDKPKDTITFENQKFKIDAEKYDRYQEIVGKVIDNNLNILFANQEYQNLTKEEKEKVVENTVSDSREYGKEYFVYELMSASQIPQ